MMTPAPTAYKKYMDRMVRELAEVGTLSVRSLMNRAEVSLSTAQRWIKKYRDGGLIEPAGKEMTDTRGPDIQLWKLTGGS